MECPAGDHDFAAWLRGIAARAGATGPEALRALLAEKGCHSSVSGVTEWLEGTSEPSFDKKREIIRCLNDAVPGLNVWDDYRNFLEGGPPMEPARPEESLEDMLKRSPGLPPPLSD